MVDISMMPFDVLKLQGGVIFLDGVTGYITYIYGNLTCI